MIIYNDIYSWQGLSGKFGLARGKIRLRIFDLSDDESADVLHLRPVIVVVSDVPGEQVSVKGWAGPLAGYIVKAFGLNPQRMMWVEYYPPVQYGKRKIKHIPEKFEAVEFIWDGERAVKPRWRDLNPPLLDTVRDLVYNS